MSRITIATAPCSWGVWYADGTPSGTPYTVFLDQAAAAGYKALELGPAGYLPTDVDKLKDELSKRELSVCAGTACYFFDRYNHFRDFKEDVDILCRRLAALNATYLVTMDESDVGSYSEKKAAFTNETWNKYMTMLKELGKYTRSEYGIETVYHPHIKSLIETEQEILRLMDYADLSLCFDTGHHAYVNGGTQHGDQSAQNFIKRYPQRIKYLHFKNVDSVVREKVLAEHLTSDQAFDIDVMCDLKDGIIDFTSLKETLDQIGFDGFGIIEQDMPKATTDQAFAAAKRNLFYLREINMIE